MEAGASSTRPFSFDGANVRGRRVVSASASPARDQTIAERTTRTGTDLYDGVPLSLSM